MRQPTLTDLKALERTFNALEKCAHDMDKFSMDKFLYQHSATLVRYLIRECESDNVIYDIHL